VGVGEKAGEMDEPASEECEHDSHRREHVVARRQGGSEKRDLGLW
jgi:hypothetical protein